MPKLEATEKKKLCFDQLIDGSSVSVCVAAAAAFAV